MKRHLVWLAAIVLVIVMSFAACGSSDTESGDAGSDSDQKVAVGLSWLEDIEQEEHGEDLQAYINTVEKAGGEPVLLPLVKNQEEAKEQLAKVDVLVMTGGEDVNPKLYGQEPDPNLEDVNDERDTSDMALLKEAIEEDMPVLCTCRGAQVLNVLQGGTLVQDIPTSDKYKDAKIKHRDPNEEEFEIHTINIEEDSILAKIVGTTKLDVNSWHHQGIDKIGDGLKVTATSEDGMVEGIELEGSAYVVGVQCHPEWSVEEGDDSFLVFFTDLMDQAKK